MKALRQNEIVYPGLEKLLPLVHANQNDITVVSGTLIEGIGNAHSDIDTYVLCEKRRLFGEVRERHAICQRPGLGACMSESDELFLTTDYIQGSLSHFEVEYWTFEEVKSVIVRLRADYEQSLQHSDFLYGHSLSSKELEFLHRICVGTALSNHEALAILIDRHEVVGKLSYLLFRSTANMYWGFKDILGALSADDAQLAYETSREYLMFQTRGLSFLQGITSQKRRWSLTYLDRMPSTKVSNLTAHIKQALFQDASTDVQKWEVVHRIVEICDLILDVERDMLDNNPFALSCSESILLLIAEMEQRQKIGHPLIEQEFAFRRRIYSADTPTLAEIVAQDAKMLASSPDLTNILYNTA